MQIQLEEEAVIMKTRLVSLRLYKINVPYESDVGVMLVSGRGGTQCQRIQLTQHTGRGRGSKAGLSKSFVDFFDWFFFGRKDAKVLLKQIFDYIVPNFCFKDLEIVPPGCPVLVFHFYFRQDQDEDENEGRRQFDIRRLVWITLEGRNPVLRFEGAITGPAVPIAPPTTEILDSYQSSEPCRLCEIGFPKEDEIVHKTRCNHIFHATCISPFLSRTPHCPVCAAHLPPVDIRTLFS